MSGYEFDELTKGLANGSSRRGVLKMFGRVLLAGTAVGALAAVGSGAAGAATTCDPTACAAQAAGNACVTCACGHAPGTSNGQGNQQCICTSKTCPKAGQQCCPSGKKAGQCVNGACPA